MKIKIAPGLRSQHFDSSEFRCPCCKKVITIAPALVYHLELLRAHFGDKPITITSGFRCRKYNDSLAGSSKVSGHMFGQAADIYIPDVSCQDIIDRWYIQAGSHGYAYTNNKNMKGVVHVEIV